MTSSNGNFFRVTGHLCGEFTGPQWIPHTQRPVTRSFDIYFDLRPNKRLSKQRWGWWSETPSSPLWRHCNDSRSTEIYSTHAIDSFTDAGALAAGRELTLDHNTLPKQLYIFEHNTQYVLIHTPYTRIMVFWPISNIPQWFRRFKFASIIPHFVYQQYLWNIAIQPAGGCYNSWANLRCSGCSPLGENCSETGLLVNLL